MFAAPAASTTPNAENSGNAPAGLTQAEWAQILAQIPATQQAKLTAAAAHFDFFGTSVSVSGDTAVVGAPFDGDGGHQSGSACVFTRSGSDWSQQAKLTADDAAHFDRFGCSVSVSGDTAVVGAYLDDDGFTNSGSAYVFTPPPTVTTEDGGDGGGKVSRKCPVGTSGIICNVSIVKVTIDENIVPDGSQIVIREVDTGNFQLGDRVFDVKVIGPDGQEITTFDPPIEICLKPTNALLKQAGWNFSNLQLFHSHAGGPWTELYDSYEKDGKLCAKISQLSEFAIGVAQLPNTGFAPGVIHIVPEQPAENIYPAYDGFRLEIPSIDVEMPVVGVPLTGQGWDVSWLGGDAGYLEGTAYPTWAGNTAITAHVWDRDNNPGPFVDLHTLQHGDEIIIHAFGMQHIYEVRDIMQVKPDTLNALPHSEYDLLTLITCKDFNASSGEYDWRLAVQAILMRVETE